MVWEVDERLDPAAAQARIEDFVQPLVPSDLQNYLQAAYLVGQADLATESVQRTLSGALPPEQAEEARQLLSE